MDKQIRYKVLSDKLISPFQSMEYELEKEHHCPWFDNNINHHCSDGFYATHPEGLVYSLNKNKTNQVYECEVWGQAVEIDRYKMRYENIKIIRKLTKSEVIKLIKRQNYDYDVVSILYPKYPMSGKPKEVTPEIIELLYKWIKVGESVGESVRASVWASVRASVWASVGESVRASVWASVGESVRASVRASVWASVGESVWASVWASVWTYVGSCFPNIKEWKNIGHESGVYPFQSAVDLWHKGFLPSFDGKTWRLHSGKKAKVVYEVGI
jgi:hypothetical protein